MESTCTCRPNWQLAETDPITAEGTDTVVLKFAQASAAVITSFVVSNVNWVASPTALQQMGEDAFRIKPVGAGPFKVVSNQLSSELVLERNPDYFVKDRPYLDKLTVRSIGGDQPAYQALLAGQGNVYEGMTTIPLLEQAKANDRLVVTQQPATSPYVIQLNTKIPPFNDKRAREAIYYATNVEAIRQGLFKGAYPASQSFTADGGLFHHATIPNYRTYDLEKAKAIVADLGGLTVDLGTLKTYVADQVNTALQTQWEAAGIKTTIHSEQLNGLIQNFVGGKWQAMLQTAGAWDPAAGVGVGIPVQLDRAVQRRRRRDRRRAAAAGRRDVRRGQARRPLHAARAAHQRRGVRPLHPGVRAVQRRHEERARSGSHHAHPTGGGEHGDPLGRSLDQQVVSSRARE